LAHGQGCANHAADVPPAALSSDRTVGSIAPWSSPTRMAAWRQDMHPRLRSHTRHTGAECGRGLTCVTVSDLGHSAKIH
jgi:hypothetical protein